VRRSSPDERDCDAEQNSARLPSRHDADATVCQAVRGDGVWRSEDAVRPAEHASQLLSRPELAVSPPRLTGGLACEQGIAATVYLGLTDR
jgi:hypothetical protein